ncbi:MAG: right-handed parallel beta-helix repeat-containing protein, partial [Anaerolineales bacterium]|nr:right-handed parallel beta-helix repeat-containing protein [Anaerolineales bacterium]
MLLTQSTTLEPRLYEIPEGITLAADGLTLDGNGATIIASSPAHNGITLTGRDAITIKNLTLLGFHHGLHARACTRLTIENCRFTHTAEQPPNTAFLDIFRPPEDPYGGGILLWNVTHSRIEHNDLSHQMCGLL